MISLYHVACFNPVFEPLLNILSVSEVPADGSRASSARSRLLVPTARKKKGGRGGGEGEQARMLFIHLARC